MILLCKESFYTRGDRQVLGFVSPVVDLDDEDDDIFESERRSSGVLNTFVNQWCVKSDTNVFKLVLRLHYVSKISEILENDALEKDQFSRLQRNKNVVNYSNLFKKSAKLKFSRKFIALN